jgi:DNA-binding GntR family transcriptional regulator
VLQSTSWFHPRIGLKGTEDTKKPLYEMIEKTTGARPKYAREEFLGVIADARLAKLLETPRGTPLLLRRHTVFDQGSRAFEFAEVHYVSSRFTLTLDMRRSEA